MMPRAATRLGRLSLTDPLDTRKCCRHRDIHFTLSFSRRVRGLGDCQASSPCSGSFAHAVLLALSVAGTPEAGKGRTWTDPRSLQREPPRTQSLEPEQSLGLQDMRGQSRLWSGVTASSGHPHSLLHVP